MSKKEITFIVFCLAAFLGYVFFHQYSILNCDTGCFVDEARYILEGKTPYLEIVDYNFPLIMYLHVIPEFVARYCGIGEGLAFFVFVSLLVLYSVFVSARLLYRFDGISRSLVRMVQMIIGIVSMQTFFIGSFGEREQLFILLFLPYVFVRVLRHEGKAVKAGSAFFIGIVAGIGVLIKPHFAAIIVGMEGFFILYSRQLKKMVTPETVGAFSFLVLFVAHFFFVPKAMTTSLFKIWLPLAAQQYYVKRESIAYLLYSNPILPFSLLSVVAAIWHAVTTSETWKKNLLLALSSIVASGIFIVVVQGKGFSYHAIPVDYSATIIMVILLISGYNEFIIKRKNGATIPSAFRSAISQKPVLIISAAVICFFIQSLIFRYTRNNLFQTVQFVFAYFSVVLCTCGLVLTLLIVFLNEKVRKKPFSMLTKLITMAVTAILCFLVVIFLREPDCSNAKNRITTPLARYILSNSKPGENIINITSLPQPTISILDRKFSSRFVMPIWPLEWSMVGKKCETFEEFPPIAKLYFDQLGQDVSIYRPRIFIMPTTVVINDMPMYEIFQKAGFFEKYLSQYTLSKAPPGGYYAFVLNEAGNGLPSTDKKIGQ
jgi:hypothetical protein